MVKRGQVTIYIIVGILIVAVIGGMILFLSRFYSERDISLRSEINGVNDYVSNCLGLSADSTLNIMMFQGGYYGYEDIKDNYIEYHIETESMSVLVPYYIKDSKLLVPSDDFLKEQIRKGIKNELKFCLNFSVFAPYIINYSYDNLNIDVQFDNKNTIDILANWPIRVYIADSSATTDNFYASVNTNFFNYYNFAKELSQIQINNLPNICDTCIDNLSKKFGFNVRSIELAGEKEYDLIYFVGPSDLTELYSFAYNIKSQNGSKQI